MALFKRKVNVTTFLRQKISFLFEPDREVYWDAARKDTEDPALISSDSGTYYANMRAVYFELLCVSVAKTYKFPIALAFRITLTNFLKAYGEVSELFQAYNSAFGSDPIDGVRQRVAVFASRVPRSPLREQTVKLIYLHFYTVLKQMYDEFKVVRLVE